MFRLLEGETAVLQVNGVLKVCDLYERHGRLFAAIGANAFVRLYANGTTSKPHMMLESLQIECALHQDRMGRLCSRPGEGWKPIEPARSQKLLKGDET